MSVVVGLRRIVLSGLLLAFMVGSAQASEALPRSFTPALSPSSTSSVTSLSSLPLSAQYAFSAAQGEHNDAYAFTVQADSAQANNPAQSVNVHFEDGSMIYAVGEDSLRFRLLDVGYETAPQPIADAITVQSAHNRLEIARGGLTEWYVNGSLGVQQGFTLDQRPMSGTGRLTLRMSLDGTLSAALSGDHLTLNGARGAQLTYGGLLAYDAHGTALAAQFALEGQTLSLVVDDTDAVYPLTIDPLVQQAYLKASNTGAGDTFGRSVAISGDTIVVGAYGEDSSATGVNGNEADNSASFSGAAYVFVRSGSVWSQQAYLKASNTDAGDFFGVSVAISGDTIVVGATQESSSATGVNGNQADNSANSAGAAYVFVRSAGVWSQEAYLKASNTEIVDFFGISVAISGDTIVVGALGEDSSATGVSGNEADNSAVAAGAAYVFVRSAGVWSQEAYLKASNTDAGDFFGVSVAISGDTIVVGAYGEASSATGVNGNEADNSGNDAGAAYVFVRSGVVWSQQAYLKASNTGVNDQFGRKLAISGDTIVVGAWTEESSATGVNGNQADNSASDAGAAYVYVRSGVVWSQQAYLKASNTGSDDLFGMSVAISGDSIVVGAYQEDSNATGVNGNEADNSASNASAAYVFERSGSVWSQQAYLKASNTGAGDNFGSSVGISGDTVVIGAESESSNATGVNGNQADNSAAAAGAAYVFVPGQTVTVAFDAATSSAAEASGIGNVLRVTTDDGNPTVNAATVAVAVTGGTATGTDYAATGTITIPAGTANNALVSIASGITVTNDAILEPDETLALTLSAPTNAVLGAQTTTTHTILNDDTASVTIANVSLAEGDSGTSNMVFTVGLNNAVQGGFTLNYATADGTATAGSDYSATSGTLTFAGTAGETQTVTVPITGDTVLEGSETFTVGLSGISNPAITVFNTATGTITNDDTATLTVSDVTDDETGPFTFTITLDHATGTGFDMTWSLVPSGTNAADYVGAVLPTNGMFTFAGTAGESKNVTIPVLDDAVVEGSETFYISLFTVTTLSGFKVSDLNLGKGVIDNNDTAAVTLADVSLAEGNAGTSLMTFTATLDKAVQGGVTVNYASANGTATAGSDYSAATGTLTFVGTVGETQTFTVPITGDTDVEGNETFTVSLNTVSNTDVTITDTATGTITNDDGATVSIAANDAAAAENPVDNGQFTVTLSQTNTTGAAITVNYTVTGTATSASDYTALSGTASIANGASTATINVTPINDALLEGPETVIVTLTGTSDASVTIAATPDDTATVTIADDDTLTVSVAANDGAAAENPVDNGQFTVTLSQTNTTGAAITVNYTVTGTATSASDYTALSGTVSIANGASTATIDVTPINDALLEGPETVIVTLTGTSNASVTVAAAPNDTATVTITDDDTLTVSVVANDAAAAENPVDNGQFTVTLSQTNTTGAAITVNYTVTGTATSGTDYTVLSGTASIANGALTATIDVTPIDDALLEGAETVIVTLTSTSDASVFVGPAPNNAATVTLADDETATVSVTANDAAAAENPIDNGQFTVTLSQTNTTGGAITINYAVTGTATSGTDYTALSGTVSIAVGAATATIDVTPIDDALLEGSETVIVTLTGTSNASVTVAAAPNDTTTITLTEDEVAVPGITLTPTSSSVVEGGIRTYTIVLNTLPTADVTITLSTISAETTIGPVLLTFTTANWNVPQTVTLSVAGNGLIDGTRTALILHDIASVGDATYDALADVTYTLTITDDDTATAIPSTDSAPSSAPSATATPSDCSVRVSGLRVVASGQADIARPGDTATWTYTVDNPSPCDLADVTVLVTFPDDDLIGVQATSSLGINGSFRKGSLLTDYALGTLRAGQSVTLTIVMRLPNRTGLFVGTLTTRIGGTIQPQSAALQILAAAQLPSTGETPWWRTGLIAILGMAGVSLLIWRRS